MGGFGPKYGSSSGIFGSVFVDSEPIFAVRDVAEAIAFYRDVLGMPQSWTWDDPPTFGSVRWGDVCLMFSRQVELAAKVEGHQHYIRVSDVDALYERHVKAGAPIVSPIQNHPWGAREYVVRDPNGYHLRFSGESKHEARSAPLPDGIAIQQRLPTVEEFRSLLPHHDEESARDVLVRTYAGWVATHAGQVVGLLRVTRDAPGWYGIWDVHVSEAWQGKHIGDALMRACLGELRRLEPPPLVFLFTYKTAFYERYGFRNENAMFLRM